MQPIIQEDRTGCGIASVASLAGVTYQHVKSTASQLGIDVKDPKLWSDTKYVRQLSLTTVSQFLLARNPSNPGNHYRHWHY